MLDFSQSTSISDNLTEVEEIENFSEESSRLRLFDSEFYVSLVPKLSYDSVASGNHPKNVI